MFSFHNDWELIILLDYRVFPSASENREKRHKAQGPRWRSGANIKGSLEAKMKALHRPSGPVAAHSEHFPSPLSERNLKEDSKLGERLWAHPLREFSVLEDSGRHSLVPDRAEKREKLTRGISLHQPQPGLCSP